VDEAITTLEGFSFDLRRRREFLTICVNEVDREDRDEYN
jgi:hypothetical protein